MKIETLNAILNTVTDQDIIAEVQAELEKMQKAADRKAAAKENQTAQYDMVHGIVVDTLRDAGAPLSSTEIWEEVCDSVPDGFTKGQMIYALSRVWNDIAKEKGRVTLYSVAE